ncbi:hypothetical protein ScPMuIL_011478 [Solemya velum]
MKLTDCLQKTVPRSGKGRQYTTAHLLRFPLLMAGILTVFSIGFRYRHLYFEDEVKELHDKIDAENQAVRTAMQIARDGLEHPPKS